MKGKTEYRRQETEYRRKAKSRNKEPLAFDFLLTPVFCLLYSFFRDHGSGPMGQTLPPLLQNGEREKGGDAFPALFDASGQRYAGTSIRRLRRNA